MWLRRAFFHWLIPAAFLLPIWLLVGWGVFQGGAGPFLWVLFIAVPSVFLGQLLLTLLVRARPTVRAQRAVSWWDVAGFALWHALTIAVGFFGPWFAPLLVGAIIVAVALFWLSLWQLWSEARSGTGRVVLRYSTASGGVTPGGVTSEGNTFDGVRAARESNTRDGDVIVLSETAQPGEGRVSH
ncbi:MFS transporter permease [Microbacterium lacus]|uniref:MFS transporter permease n=1 Tax=Microbacterium lacus TaxID=415217 RepID=UPI001E303F49|nr:MFS transporter permease [Microbacterium lacus]|tara:strand:+ start:129 stop:680 length:552 start_codon:yes stop_codon:yes gene_type:complete